MTGLIINWGEGERKKKELVIIKTGKRAKNDGHVNLKKIACMQKQEGPIYTLPKSTKKKKEKRKKEKG